MKRILVLSIITTLFFLSSSSALAKGPKEGKGKPDTAGAQAQKGKGKAAKKEGKPAKEEAKDEVDGTRRHRLPEK